VIELSKRFDPEVSAGSKFTLPHQAWRNPIQALQSLIPNFEFCVSFHLIAEEFNESWAWPSRVQGLA
jgi:hypothetical protein